MSRLIGTTRFVVMAWVLVPIAFGFPRAGQASFLEEMAGELRLRAPVGVAPFVAFEAAPFGSFHLVPEGAGGGGPGTVTFTVPGGTLTAEWVRDNGVREVDPLTGQPIEPTPINANAFDAMCALTKGHNPFDREACVFTIYNSWHLTGAAGSFSPRVMITFTNILSGQPGNIIGGPGVLRQVAGFTQTTIDELNALRAGGAPIQTYLDQSPPTGFGPNTPTPLVSLSRDPNDASPLDGPCGAPFEFGCAVVPPELSQLGDTSVTPWIRTALQPYLTDEQEALLGCGSFYGTQCDIDGLGLMGYEVSALGQSWPRFDLPSGEGNWLTTDASRTQPGTVGFQGDPVCARYEGGGTTILPGCRGPGDPGYDINVDGSTTGFDIQWSVSQPWFGPSGERLHPFTGQPFASEMAVVSWNHLMLHVALSFVPDELPPGDPGLSYFDPDQPFRTDGCSFANPLGCWAVADAISYATRAPEEDPSQPPLARWLWEAGAEYLVTEATGDLMDFADPDYPWALFGFGPEQSRVSGVEVGVAFLLSPRVPLSPIPDSPLIVRWGGVDGIVGTADDNFAGVVYGPEPGAALLQLSALGVVTLLGAFRRRRAGPR